MSRRVETAFNDPTGGVYRREGSRRPVWYAHYRLPDGRQIRKRIGPAWTERGRPPKGYFTERTAEAWLRDLLDEARRGTLPGMVRTGATFADAAAEHLRYIEHDRTRKLSTVSGYRSVINTHLLPAFDELPVESVTTAAIENWVAGFSGPARTLLERPSHDAEVRQRPCGAARPGRRGSARTAWPPRSSDCRRRSGVRGRLRRATWTTRRCAAATSQP